jgi:hypothetical protein
MKIEIERIENASKDILEGFDGNRHENKGAKEALEMLIRHFKELEESGEQSFSITWCEEDVANAHPEIPEEHRWEVLQMFEDEVNELDGVWDRMWNCLNDVAQDFIDGLPAETIEVNAK